jgi:asparagine synthase (glutamine-hydrolysing)
MCGITGGFALKSEGRQFLNRIQNANACIRHRGPDGDGVFLNDTAALGHRRLSIIDTSSAADQPMFSKDQRFCMVFNGEIFNYKELQEKYFPNHSFRTTSDTEVFLELFIKLGTECFVELRGFFVAAIYDSDREEMFVVRDRFGKKPLHFYESNEVVLFSSELKSLLSFGISKELVKEVLPYYFQFNYLPQPLSFIKGVKKLKPGHYLKIKKEGIEQVAYFTLAVQENEYGSLTYEAAKTKLHQLLDKATNLRLISDVPLGSFLSGGIDSSVIVGLASRHKQKLKTFSVGYKDNPFFDETYYAELVAKKFNTEHTTFRLGNDDFLEHIDNVLDAIDEPFADSSAIPTYILSKYTREQVTVALSGDGGDEVFAGYNKHEAEWNMMQTSLKKNLVKGLRPLWKLLPKSRNNKLTNTFRQLHRFAEGANLTPTERYWRWASITTKEQSKQLFASALQPSLGVSANASDLFPLTISGNDLNEVLLADMQMVLVGDMLVKVDMMSMANSLEIRSPFLDQEVVNFAFGLPAHYKIDGKLKKKIVQDTFRDLLPSELYNRPKKGFDIPLLDWFRKELWSKINDDLLSDIFIKEQQLFDLTTIQQLKRKLHSKNPEDSHETIWALVVFQHWWKKNIA